MEYLAGMLARVVRELEESAVPDEALATLKRSRFGGVKLVPLKPGRGGRAWRLGVILLARDGTLYASGEVTRAVEPQRGVANKSQEAEDRRELRRAAVRGRFPEGEVVNFGFTPIDVEAASGPVTVVDGIPLVRWNRAANPRPLEAYLAERIALLTDD